MRHQPQLGGWCASHTLARTAILLRLIGTTPTFGYDSMHHCYLLRYHWVPGPPWRIQHPSHFAAYRLISHHPFRNQKVLIHWSHAYNSIWYPLILQKVAINIINHHDPKAKCDIDSKMSCICCHIQYFSFKDPISISTFLRVIILFYNTLVSYTFIAHRHYFDALSQFLFSSLCTRKLQ